MHPSLREQKRSEHIQALDQILETVLHLAKEDGWHIACFLSQLVCLCYVHYRHPHLYFVHFKLIEEVSIL